NMISNSSYPNLIVLDVRTQTEYDTSHLDNSILIPLDELETRINELSEFRDVEIIVYCRTGRRSAEASEILDVNNFTKIFNVLGGITAWEDAGYLIIPEFSTWIALPFILLSIVTILIIKRRIETNSPR
ncbi:rhodanese-like domain-containing protein, partial [Candidatus Bathyarchaeota archaeon]|nr:rhodanese-like domain-containing protein [Candidatus Bathyarchaeota archaeon]